MTVFSNEQIELVKSIEAECAKRNAECYISHSDMEYVNSHSEHFNGHDDDAVLSMIDAGIKPRHAKDLVRVKNLHINHLARIES